jgi:hypothetical protein
MLPSLQIKVKGVEGLRLSPPLIVISPETRSIVSVNTMSVEDCPKSTLLKSNKGVGATVDVIVDVSVDEDVSVTVDVTVDVSVAAGVGTCVIVTLDVSVVEYVSVTVVFSVDVDVTVWVMVPALLQAEINIRLAIKKVEINPLIFRLIIGKIYSPMWVVSMPKRNLYSANSALKFAVRYFNFVTNVHCYIYSL